MKHLTLEKNTFEISENNGAINITAGDTDFQKTLTKLEKNYVHQGMNWISKFARETELKSLHNIGYTLDQIEALPLKEKKEIWKKATETWNATAKNRE